MEDVILYCWHVLFMADGIAILGDIIIKYIIIVYSGWCYCLLIP